MSDTDWELLARYTRHQAEDAFAEIVRRHLDLVHSAALRQVRSPQLAEEVAQSVFLKLVRHAPQLPPTTILAAWLYQVTSREAIDVVRQEARRRLREQIASEMNAMNATAADWRDIEPLLDEAMQALDETDRAAVLLRYFENKSLREVGAALDTTDDAARKRIGRAVECLREFFVKRGVTVGAGGLVVVLSANAVQAAPVGLAATISMAAASTGATLITTASAATKVIAMTTLQKSLIAAALAAAVGVGIYEARQVSSLRTHVQILQEQQAPLAGQIQQLEHERDEAMQKLAATRNDAERLNAATSQLVKLRAEVSRLRREQDDSLKQLAVKATPPPVHQAGVNAAWVQQVLNSSPKDQGAAAGNLRGKQLRSEVTNISPSEIALRDALLQRELNQSLERTPAEFADFQTAFIESALGITDETKVQKVREIIQATYEHAVANGLDIPSKPANGADTWVQQRFQLDREATAAVKTLFTPEERSLFNRAFVGVMGIDLGGLGVDKSNYPKGFLGPD